MVEVRGGRDVGVEDGRELAGAELRAVGGEPGRHAAAGRCRSGARLRRDRGLGGRALDREVAAGDVLPVVGALGADRAGGGLLGSWRPRSRSARALAAASAAIVASRSARSASTSASRLEGLDGRIALRLEEAFSSSLTTALTRMPPPGRVDEAVVEVGALDSSGSMVALFGSLNCTTEYPSSATAALGSTAMTAATAAAPIHGFTSHSLRLKTLGTPPKRPPILRDS